MLQKIKMVALPLFFSIALVGCGKNLPHLDLSAIKARPDLPADAYAFPEWPAPPTGPLSCIFDGKPALCQSDVAVWVETQVKPDFEAARAAHEALRATCLKND